MSTTLLNKDTVTRKWYVLDAAGKPMGKTAALAADLLRGKLKTDYTPHVDCGDFVIIINAEQAVLTGKKLEQKYYRTHSGYPGGLHETQYKKLMKDKPELVKMVKDILEPVGKMDGDSLPVSAFVDHVDGQFELGAAAYEKRGVAPSCQVAE